MEVLMQSIISLTSDTFHYSLKMLCVKRALGECYISYKKLGVSGMALNSIALLY
jgi:hypothetical protein